MPKVLLRLNQSNNMPSKYIYGLSIPRLLLVLQCTLGTIPVVVLHWPFSPVQKQRALVNAQFNATSAWQCSKPWPLRFLMRKAANQERSWSDNAFPGIPGIAPGSRAHYISRRDINVDFLSCGITELLTTSVALITERREHVMHTASVHHAN